MDGTETMVALVDCLTGTQVLKASLEPAGAGWCSLARTPAAVNTARCCNLTAAEAVGAHTMADCCCLR